MSIIAEEKISNLKNFIDSHDNFYIIGHKEPDGDCISSSLGIAEILKKFNKKYQLLSAGPFKRPEIKQFEKQFTKFPKKNFNKENSAVIIVDCSEFYRFPQAPSGAFVNRSEPRFRTSWDFLAVLDCRKQVAKVKKGTSLD